MKSMLVFTLLTFGFLGSSFAADDGKALFHAKCGMCHLEGGTGTFMLRRRLGAPNALLESRTNLDAQYVRFVARNGIVSMPRFNRAELPDNELQAIASYLSRSASGPAK